MLAMGGRVHGVRLFRGDVAGGGAWIQAPSDHDAAPLAVAVCAEAGDLAAHMLTLPRWKIPPPPGKPVALLPPANVAEIGDDSDVLAMASRVGSRQGQTVDQETATIRAAGILAARWADVVLLATRLFHAGKLTGPEIVATVEACERMRAIETAKGRAADYWQSVIEVAEGYQPNAGDRPAWRASA